MSTDLKRAGCCAPALLVAGASACFSLTAVAADLAVTPATELQRAISQARPGDVLRLRAGQYPGPILIDRSITLIGEPGSRIDGDGRGRVVTINAPDVSMSRLTIVNSGSSLATEDSGIFVTVEGDRARIFDNRLEHNLIGVYLKGPEDAVVENNTIVGRDDLRMSERGNGVQLWNTPGSVVAENDIRFGRDGIFVTTSNRNIFRGNRFRDLRFAIHYMFTNDSEVSRNVSSGNHVGYALMFSHRLKVVGNVSRGDRDRGIFLNYANYSDISGNAVYGGAEKCVFIYNANGNRFYRNRFENCEIGVHFTAGSEQNRIFENAFVDNRTQVKYVGTRHIEWSMEGRGNYWSDNLAFDLDGDGIADRPYQPNNIVDQVIWRYPASKLLFNSPALHLLRWAQSQFPALHPGGVMDSAPLINPPHRSVQDG
jgi:nitrous oxidase accessory protein